MQSKQKRSPILATNHLGESAAGIVREKERQLVCSSRRPAVASILHKMGCDSTPHRKQALLQQSPKHPRYLVILDLLTTLQGH